MLRSFFKIFLIIAVVSQLCIQLAYAGIFEDEHSVDQIIESIQTPLSEEELTKARQVDDQLLSSGNFMGIRGYLVTDPQINDMPVRIVNRLLDSMDENPGNWVTRVIDPDPQIVNAFVTGGKYIYVFKPLISQAASEDELAFILGHELGHSYLHHISRQEDSSSQTIADIADIISLLTGGKKSLQQTRQYTQLLRASFSQSSEREADAFAAALLWKTGYDPVRGADFFLRQKRNQDEYFKNELQSLQTERAEVDRAIAACEQYNQAYQAYGGYDAYVNMQQVCTASENMRTSYNAHVEKYNQELSYRQASIYSSHPTDNGRVAYIVSINDYLNSRRELASLESNYPQAFKTITALDRVQSPLLVKNTPESSAKEEPASGSDEDVLEKLKKLKVLFENEVITEDEYKEKKKELLDKL